MINEIILFLGKDSISLVMDWWFYFYPFYFYLNNQFYYSDFSSIWISICGLTLWIKLSISILISKLISNTSYQMKYDINIDRIFLQQSSILSILDFHQISKNSRNIYSFMIIHTNTFDWFGLDISEWIRKFNCLKIRNIYSIFNHSISN